MYKIIILLLVTGLFIPNASAFIIKGTDRTLDAPAYKIRGVEYLPLTLVCDAHGINWDWDPVSEIVELDKGSVKLRLRVGEYKIYANGMVIVEERPVIFHKGAVCVPSDFLKTISKRFAWVEPSGSAVPENKPAVPQPRYYKIRSVILDAGHGGYDPGAIGRDGIKEKYITLDITNRVRGLLENEGIEVILTRDDDSFIPLWRRTEIANRVNADLFVSIHANASRTKRLKGVEVYYLSEAIDDDARAKAAAQDAVLKTEKGSVYRHTDVLDAILWDLALTEARRDSIQLGNSILDEIDVPKRALKSARFFVLKGTKMPAVLVEVGYITNKDECSKLGGSQYRAEIAKMVVRGILGFRRQFESSGGFTD